MTIQTAPGLAEITRDDYRDIFGLLPTAVVAITGQTQDRRPMGLVVGTFASLSMEPPLATFSVDKSSNTWPWLRSLSRFTANILSTDQLPVCKALARKGDEKFEGLQYHESQIGTPRLPDSVAWIDCEVLSEVVAGDHYVVVGAISRMERGTGEALIFRGGQFGEYTPWPSPNQTKKVHQ